MPPVGKETAQEIAAVLACQLLAQRYDEAKKGITAQASEDWKPSSLAQEDHRSMAGKSFLTQRRQRPRGRIPSRSLLN